MKLTACMAAVLALLAVTAGSASAAPGRYAKVCTTCHKTVDDNTIRGLWEDSTMKSSSLQIKVDADSEIIRFDPAVLKLVNAPEQGVLERQLNSIRKNAEVRVSFVEKNGVRFATELAVKPKLKVAADKLLKTEDVEKLVAAGTGYYLFDARPAPPYAEGYITTAVNLPFPAFEKEKGKLPADKNALVVFYCSGVT